MTPYESTSGKESGVLAYRTGPDFIMVKFEAGIYTYTIRSCDADAIEEMKALATQQCGLSTYIAQNDPRYENKIPSD